MNQYRVNSNHPYLSKISAEKRIDFQFEFKHYKAFQGDNLASALLANGVITNSRSFKYGRFRGIFSAGVEEPNCLVNVIGQENQLDSLIPNLKAPEVELFQNLKATSATTNPHINFDWRALLRPIHQFMPAGFYYKTFTKPKWLLPTYEKILRSLAGFSNTPTTQDPDRYTHRYHQCDLLVIGGGISGLSAAKHAADKNFRVYLVDEKPFFGGQFSQNGHHLNASKDLQKLIKEVKEHPKISSLSRSSAIAYLDQNLVLVSENCLDFIEPSLRQKNQARHILHKIRAKKVLLATGSHERGLLFSNNDLPGVMLASSVQYYLHYFAICPGQEIVVIGNNNSIYQVALDLKNALQDCDASISLVDTRVKVDEKYTNQLFEQSINYYLGFKPTQALGKKRIKGIQLEFGERKLFLNTDLIAMSGGFNPVCHLDCHTGDKPYFSKAHQSFLPDSFLNLKKEKATAGSVNGFNDYIACQTDAINQVNRLLQLNEAARKIKDTPLETENFFIPDSTKYQGKYAFVDYQNDVKVSDIELSIRENYRSVEHIKRYSALGFGTDQGKTSNVNGIAVAANAMKTDLNTVGTTTFRPSYTPVAFGLLGGLEINDTFDPQRFTAIHQAHLKQGAKFELVGQWYRPHYFPKESESLNQAVCRESLQARKKLAMMDASTLGKIDIQGEDAREFISRIYTNALSKIQVGQCRYVLMCNEDGMIMDDGVVACLAENHFLATTTTGGAAAVLHSMESWLETEWPELKVWLNSVTDHYSTIALVGPQSRQFIAEFCKDIDFSQENFAFMHFKEGTINGIDVRIMRVSFSGELAYEVNVQSNYALYLWNQFLDKGIDYDLTLYGTETMHVLRAEKGYLIVGQDTDGSITPIDANMNWAVAKNKPFSFIGERSLSRSDLMRKGRKQLVGLLPKDKNIVIEEGAQIINAQDETTMQGHVTSSYFSPILNQSIAMAVIKGGLDRMGETVYAKSSKKEAIETLISPIMFYDPDNKRINGEDQ